MSHASDFLRSLGISDEQVTSAQADLDQGMAEADHLIDHAVRLHVGSIPAAAAEALLIREHLDDYDRHKTRAVLAALVSRSGQLAMTVMRQSAELKEARTALAEAESGRSKWWRR